MEFIVLTATRTMFDPCSMCTYPPWCMSTIFTTPGRRCFPWRHKKLLRIVRTQPYSTRIYNFKRKSFYRYSPRPFYFVLKPHSHVKKDERMTVNYFFHHCYSSFLFYILTIPSIFLRKYFLFIYCACFFSYKIISFCMNVYHNYWPIKFLNVTLLSHFQLPVLLYLKISVSTLNPQKENVSLSIRFIRKTPVAFIVFGVLLLMFNLTLLLSCSRLTNLVDLVFWIKLTKVLACDQGSFRSPIFFFPPSPAPVFAGFSPVRSLVPRYQSSEVSLLVEPGRLFDMFYPPSPFTPAFPSLPISSKPCRNKTGSQLADRRNH